MYPIRSPLAGRVDGDVVGEGKAWGDTALGALVRWFVNLRNEGDQGGGRDAPLRDAHGAIVPGGRVEEHAVVVEGSWLVDAVRCMDEEQVVRRDVDWWWPTSASVTTRRERARTEDTYGQVPLTPITRRGWRPSGLAFST